MPAPENPSLGARVHAALRELSPGYFAATMATGILSIGFRVDGFGLLSGVLLLVTVLSFVGLLVLNLWRLLSHRQELLEDFEHPLRGFGFYSFVAAAEVVAARVAGSQPVVAVALLALGAGAWLLRGYAVPWTTRLGPGERPIVAAANGTWFMWAVAGESVSVAASVLAGHWTGQLLPMVAVMAWGIGLFLYVVDGVFVAMRLLAYDFSAADLTPPYWVAMGAAAVTVLAASHLAALPPGPFAAAVRPSARGCALALWAVATWLLPSLFAMGWWRHVTHRIPLTYDASLWSIVFPLGMYAVATRELALVEDLPWLGTLGSAWIWVGFAAWLLLAAAMAQHVLRDVLRAGTPNA